jgi:hypothetical protein
MDWFLLLDQTTAQPAPTVSVGPADGDFEQAQTTEPAWITSTVTTGIETTSTTTEPPHFEALTTGAILDDVLAETSTQPFNNNTQLLVDQFVETLNNTLTTTEATTIANRDSDLKAYVSKPSIFIFVFQVFTNVSILNSVFLLYENRQFR